jgi:hypothetical protein
MSSTCFKTEGSNSGRRLYMQLWYGITEQATYHTVCCPGWNVPNPTSTTDSHLQRIISNNCCIHTVVPPDDGLRYARNM